MNDTLSIFEHLNNSQESLDLLRDVNTNIKLKHFRRYSTKDLQAKLIGVGFKIVRRSHLGFIVFPAFAAVKLIGKLLKSKNDMVVEQRTANTSKNPFVRLALALEYRILRRYKLPFGIRTIITAKK